MHFKTSSFYATTLSTHFKLNDLTHKREISAIINSYVVNYLIHQEYNISNLHTHACQQVSSIKSKQKTIDGLLEMKKGIM